MLQIPSGEYSSLFASDSEDAWELMKDQARELVRNPPYTTKELRRHASISTDNNHRCKNCFCCACVEVLENFDYSYD
jgi:hypothetical protein